MVSSLCRIPRQMAPPCGKLVPPQTRVASYAPPKKHPLTAVSGRIRAAEASSTSVPAFNWASCISRCASTSTSPRRRTRSSPSPPSSPPSPTTSSPSPHDLSTVALGNLYEAYCLSLLTSALPGLTLQKVGGAGDKGVDLRGWWDLDAFQTAVGAPESLTDQGAPRRIRVLVQCKASKHGWESADEGSTVGHSTAPTSPIKKLGPVILRELEGVLGRQRHHLARRMSLGDGDMEDADADADTSESEDLEVAQQRPARAPPTLIAILCSSAGFSKQTMLQTMSQVEENIVLVHSPLPPFSPLASRETAPEPQSAASSKESSPDGETSDAELALKESDLDLPSAIVLSSSLRSSRGPLRGKLKVGTRRYLPSPSAPGAGKGLRGKDVQVAGDPAEDTTRKGKTKAGAAAQSGERAFLLWCGREVRLSRK